MGDEDGPGVAEEAEPEDLAGARHARVDGSNVTNVGADDPAGGRERDGEEDFPVVPVEELGAEARGVGWGSNDGRVVVPLADEPDGEDGDVEARRARLNGSGEQVERVAGPDGEGRTRVRVVGG